MLDWLSIETVLLINAVAWHYALFCGFVSDDHAVIEKRKDIIPDGEKSPRKEPFLTKVMNDGVVMFFLNRIMWWLFGCNTPFWWHLLNVLLHFGNVVMIYVLLTPIVGQQVSLVVVLLWSINPMQNQVVVWCSGRPYAIATMLALVALLNFDAPYIFVPCYVLGVVTGMTVGFLPVIGKLMYPASQWGTWYLCLYIIAIPWVVWKFTQRFGKGALILDRQNYRFTKRRFNNLVRMLVYYVVTMAFPVKMGWYHEAGFRYNKKWDGFNIWAVVGYGLTGYLATTGLPGWWLMLGLLPNMNVMATNSYVQDRYVYFGSIGLALLAAPYFIQYSALCVAVVAVYVSKSYTYTRQMVNDERLYKENWRNHPRSDYAINNYGFFLIQQQRFDEAREIIKRGIDINRGNKLLWYNLGITWAAQGNLQSQEGKFRFLRAMDCWKMCLNIEPRWRKPFDDLQRLIKYLVDNKVLTPNKTDGATNMPSIDVPAADNTKG